MPRTRSRAVCQRRVGNPGPCGAASGGSRPVTPDWMAGAASEIVMTLVTCDFASPATPDTRRRVKALAPSWGKAKSTLNS